MRTPLIPSKDRSAVRIGFGFAAAVGFLVLIGFLTSCSPRTFNEVNKQAPRPDVYGERPGLSGVLMYTARYLRDTEPLKP